MIENNLQIGDVTTVNLDIIKGGNAINIIPDAVDASYDMRVSPKANFNQISEMLITYNKDINISFQFLHNEKAFTTDLNNIPICKFFEQKAKNYKSFI